MRGLLAFLALVVLPLAPAQVAVFGEEAGYVAPSGGGDTVTTASLVARWVADSGVYSDAGTTLLDTLGEDGAAVQQWQATHGSFTLGNTTAAQKPSFQWAELNGLPGIEFDGSADNLVTGAPVVSLYPLSVYVVASADSDAVSGTLAAVFDTNINTHYYIFRAWGSAAGDPLSFIARSGGTEAYSDTTTGYTASTAFTGSFISAANNSRFAYIDGGSGGSNSDFINPSGLDNFSVGAIMRPSPFDYFDGKIFEIRVYSAAHDSTEQATIEAELASKWGL